MTDKQDYYGWIFYLVFATLYNVLIAYYVENDYIVRLVVFTNMAFMISAIVGEFIDFERRRNGWKSTECYQIDL